MFREERRVSLEFSQFERGNYDEIAAEAVQLEDGKDTFGHQFKKLQDMRMACVHPSLQETRQSLHSGQHDICSESQNISGGAADFSLPTEMAGVRRPWRCHSLVSMM